MSADKGLIMGAGVGIVFSPAVGPFGIVIGAAVGLLVGAAIGSSEPEPKAQTDDHRQ